MQLDYSCGYRLENRKVYSTNGLDSDPLIYWRVAQLSDARGRMNVKSYVAADSVGENPTTPTNESSNLLRLLRPCN
jgi:hypothetical protein